LLIDDSNQNFLSVKKARVNINFCALTIASQEERIPALIFSFRFYFSHALITWGWTSVAYISDCQLLRLRTTFCWQLLLPTFRIAYMYYCTHEKNKVTKVRLHTWHHCAHTHYTHDIIAHIHIAHMTLLFTCTLHTWHYCTHKIRKSYYHFPYTTLLHTCLLHTYSCTHDIIAHIHIAHLILLYTCTFYTWYYCARAHCTHNLNTHMILNTYKYITHIQ